MNPVLLIKITIACGALIASGMCAAQDEFFVTNANSNSVTVYARTASGNVEPVRVLSGPGTGLGSPSGIAVDLVNDELLVVNRAMPGSVTVYPRTASGNTVPLRTLSGPLTTFNDPRGISVDPLHGEYAVANRAGASITTFVRMASGDVAPVRTLLTTGFTNPSLSNPWGVLIDVAHDEIVVANNGRSVSVFARTDDGTANTLRMIVGDNTGFNNGPIGIALDNVNDELVVTNPYYGASFLPAIMWFGRTESGNVSPSGFIGGSSITGLSSSNGIAVDAQRGEFYTVNSLNNSITVHSRAVEGLAAPLRTISGAKTLLNNPQFIVLVTTFLFADSFESP